jgi:hypothetical protein
LVEISDHIEAIMAFLKGSEFIRQSNGATTQITAWKDGYYETYQIGVTLPAVRLHARFHRRFGRWFAVDRYDDSVAEYRNAMALINRADAAESYLLSRGAVFNVGIVKEQGVLAGGGWQFEYVRGPLPLPVEHVPNLKGGSRVPL